MDQHISEKVPIDQLAQLDADKSILFFGVLPLAVIGVLAVVCVVLYFIRRSKNWNDLGEAMRLDDGDKPVEAGAEFGDGELSDMDPTKPSERLSGIRKDG